MKRIITYLIIISFVFLALPQNNVSAASTYKAKLKASVSVKSSAKSSSKKLGTLKKNSIINVTSYNSSYVKTVYKKKTGYILKKYAPAYVVPKQSQPTFSPIADPTDFDFKIAPEDTVVCIGTRIRDEWIGSAKYPLKFKTSDPSVVEFKDGDFFGVSPGESTVSATAGNRTVSFKIRVIDGYVNPVVAAYFKKDKTFLNSNDLKVYSKAMDIIQNIIQPEMTDLEKEKSIHDYLCLNTQYDYDNYINDTTVPESYDSYGVLVNGLAVCSGYADANGMLLSMVGVKNRYISGYASNDAKTWAGHAWNKVFVNGTWFNVDVTWDDIGFWTNDTSKFTYDYFNRTDEEINMDHRISTP